MVGDDDGLSRLSYGGEVSVTIQCVDATPFASCTGTSQCLLPRNWNEERQWFLKWRIVIPGEVREGGGEGDLSGV